MSVNKVILVGNLTRDAEIRQAGQTNVASFGIATSEKYKDRNGQLQENTEFHNCELFGSEGVHPYLKKGQLVYAEGSIRTDKWTDQQGQQHSVTKIRVLVIQLLGPKQQPNQGYAPQQPMAPQYQQPAPQYQQPAPAPQYPPQYQQPQYAPQPQPQYPPQYPPQAPVDDLP